MIRIIDKEFRVEEKKLLLDIKVKYDFTYKLEDVLDETSVTTNDGTYAKIMPNIVPFGEIDEDKLKELVAIIAK